MPPPAILRALTPPQARPASSSSLVAVGFPLVASMISSIACTAALFFIVLAGKIAAPSPFDRRTFCPATMAGTLSDVPDPAPITGMIPPRAYRETRFSSSLRLLAESITLPNIPPDALGAGACPPVGVGDGVGAGCGAVCATGFPASPSPYFAFMRASSCSGVSLVPASARRIPPSAIRFDFLQGMENSLRGLRFLEARRSAGGSVQVVV